MKFTPKKKQPKSICVAAFPNQFKRHSDARLAVSGVKAQSGSQKQRNAVYGAIAAMFKERHPNCKAFGYGHPKFCCSPTTEVHHVRGRSGLLLFDTRFFLPVCSNCHRWIHDHPAEAKKLGLLQDRNEREE